MGCSTLVEHAGTACPEYEWKCVGGCCGGGGLFWYIRRVGEAKGKERKMREVKEVVKIWVIGGEDTEPDYVLIESKEDGGAKARKRKKDVS